MEQDLVGEVGETCGVHIVIATYSIGRRSVMVLQQELLTDNLKAVSLCGIVSRTSSNVHVLDVPTGFASRFLVESYRIIRHGSNSAA